MLAVALTVIAFAAFLARSGQAQTPGPQPDGAVSVTAATVSSRINYQGVLKEGGSLVTGSRNFTFRFYTAVGCATPVGSPVVSNGVAVANGLFSVKLDVDQALFFDGRGLWLGVDVGGAGNVACEEITPVPYALSLRPGAVIVGNIAGSPVLSVTNTYSPTLEAASVQNGGGYGVYGRSNSGDGVAGQSDTGNGVYGYSENGDGVAGQSINGDGVFGYSKNGDGGSFRSSSTSHYGLRVVNVIGGRAARFDGGVQINGDVNLNGEIYAQSLHTVDKGTTTSGVNSYGAATYSSVSVSTGGGEARALAGGEVRMDAGGFAIYPAAPGAALFAVLSHNGAIQTQGGVNAQGIGSFAGAIYGGNDLSVAHNAAVSGNATVAGQSFLRGNVSADHNVYIGGNVTVAGAKSAVVATASHGARTLYADESAEVYFFDRGGGQLVNGVATIALDPIWLETVTIDADHPMRVQVTLTGDCNGVYVVEKTATGFTVRELRGGASNATFDWEVAAKRKGYEEVRLAPVEPEQP
jgi:hypothetical protein